MTDHEDEVIERVTNQYERRLSEECGKLRVETATLRADMNKGFGDLRTTMAERNADLLKWILGFWLAQIAAIAALMALMR